MVTKKYLTNKIKEYKDRIKKLESRQDNATYYYMLITCITEILKDNFKLNSKDIENIEIF